MNIIINITKTLFEESNVEKRSLRTKIKKNLHRVKIVENSKTLKLLRQTIVLLTIDSSSQTISNKDSNLYDILQRMQTIIEQLQKRNENSTSKSKNYTNVVRFVVESIAMSKRVEKRVEKFFKSKTIKQIKEFTINIINDEEKKKLKEVIMKDIMKKMRVERIRDIIRFENDALKIQTKSTKIKNALQKQSEMIRKIIVSITIHSRIYVVRVNEIRIEHIDENNQTNFITYLQNNNARLHLNLIIKKMIWSSKIIRKKKNIRFFISRSSSWKWRINYCSKNCWKLLKSRNVNDSSKIVLYDNASIVKNTITSINIAKLLSYTIRARKNIARAIAISTSSTSTKDAIHMKIVNTSRESRTAK